MQSLPSVTIEDVTGYEQHVNAPIFSNRANAFHLREKLFGAVVSAGVAGGGVVVVVPGAVFSARATAFEAFTRPAPYAVS